MITKIEKIKNLGIFTDYKWDSNLPEFKRFNLIYGWNGSGKTALSQLFASFETGKSEIYPELEYEIQTADGNFTQKNVFNTKIRVFNQEYISENIEILSGKAKPIFILGKENKELADAIKQDKKIRCSPLIVGVFIRFLFIFYSHCDNNKMSEQYKKNEGLNGKITIRHVPIQIAMFME